jgi:hypothetical protein
MVPATPLTSCAELEILGDFGGSDLERGHHAVEGSDQRAEDDRRQAEAVFARAFIPRHTDAQDFRTRDAFGIGKIRVDDERPAQRHRQHHPQHTARSAGQHRRPIGEVRPPAHDHQARQDEDHRRNRARGAADRLDDIILDHIRSAERAQHGH